MNARRESRRADRGASGGGPSLCGVALVLWLRARVARAAARAHARRAQPARRRATAVHVVQRGETLYKIAWQHRVDQQELASWNGIRDPDVLRVGQRLRLVPPRGYVAAAPAPARAVSASRRRHAQRRRLARRPTRAARAPANDAPAARARTAAACAARRRRRAGRGRPTAQVVTRFGADDGIGSGIGIGGRDGQPVRAAAAGRIVYAGGGLIGYGQLVIIKHDETFLTAYGYNSELLVTQGQDVARGARRSRRWGKGRSASRGCTSRFAATACPSIRCCSSPRRAEARRLRAKD